MLWYVCFALTVLIGVLMVQTIFSPRFGKTRILYIMFGCLAVAYILYIPPFFMLYNPITALFGNFINVLQVISLDADYLMFYELIQNEIEIELISNLYSVLLALIHVVLPAVSAMTAVTLVVQLFNSFQISIIKKRKRNLHIFSQLNYRSITLARDLRKYDKKSEIIFLGNKDEAESPDLQQELRCTIIGEQVESIRASATNRKVINYCISNDCEENLNAALSILSYLEGASPQEQRNNTVYLFSNDSSAELLIDSVNKGLVNISIINERRAAAYTLLQQYPLVNYVHNGALRVLLCGFHATNIAVLQAVAWCGQIGGCSLQIQVLAQNVETEAANFKALFPGLMDGHHNISFISYHNKLEFQQKFAEHQMHRANYIVVAENDCDTTIDHAVLLRRMIYQADPSFASAPPIFAHVENNEKAAAVTLLRTAEAKLARRMSYQITPFGTAGEIYSYRNITGSDLERLSQNVHLVYEDIFSDSPIDVPAALERYNLFEVNKNSNRANALHIRYKLLMLGLDYTDSPDAEEVDLADYLTEDSLVQLTHAEHDRWMAFLESEGWTSATVEQSKAYQASGISKGRHNCPLLQMHPYICPFEELQARSEVLGLPDSTVYDRELIVRIGDILHDKWNVSGKRYKIIKCNKGEKTS